MAQDTSPDKNSAPKTPASEKRLFALAVTIIALSGLVLVVLMIMAGNHISANEKAAPADFSFNNAKDLLTILLPLVSTWVGTILAFYFSKENFAAANQRVKEMVSQIAPIENNLKSINATDVMIKIVDASLQVVDGEPDFEHYKLTDLIGKMEGSHSERLLILEAKTLRFIFLIYRTTIERFLLGIDNGIYSPKPDPARPMNQQSFLPVTASLDDVKKAMADNDICQDVFITKTGNRAEAVEGWITNNMIVEKAQLFRKNNN